MRGPVLLFVALFVAACGSSPTGPTSGTRVEAVVSDPPTGSPTVNGTLAGNIHASMWDGNRWVELGSPNGITIPLQVARTTTIHGEASAPAASYNRVRITFQGVTARLARGSVVGGTTLGNDVSITLGGSDQRAEVIAPVNSFPVEAEPRVRRVITFELRSQQWLTSAALQSGRVEDAALEAAIAATTRAESR